MKFRKLTRVFSRRGAVRTKRRAPGILPMSLCLACLGILLSSLSSWVPILELETAVKNVTVRRYNYSEDIHDVNPEKEVSAVVVNWDTAFDEEDNSIEFEVQYWSFNWISYFWKSPDGKLVVSDTHAILYGLPMITTMGFRIRTKQRGWLSWSKWLDDSEWGPWSDIIYLPPNGSAYTALHMKYIFNHKLCLVVALVVAIEGWAIVSHLYNRKKGKSDNFMEYEGNDAVSDVAELQSRIGELEQDLQDAEHEIRRLMRMKGHGLHTLQLDEVRALEEELEKGLKIVRKEKELLLLHDQDKHMCVICRSQEKSVLLLPCRHLCLCGSCMEDNMVQSCPVCRGTVSNTVDVYS